MVVPVRVGFLGAGKIAQAIVSGLTHAGTIATDNIVASSPKSDNTILQKVAELGIKTTFDNRKVVESSDVVVVAVKPNMTCQVLNEVSSVASKRQLFMSVALGVPLATMEQILPPGSRVVRVMPNTPALVRHSASVYSLGNNVVEGDEELVKKLLSSIGYVEKIPESLMDCATGLSGSGPAYGYVTIQALSDGGVKMGMPRALATRMAAMSVLGAARMILETGHHPDSLRDDVCSPGGCTIHAMHFLERTGLRSSLIGAVETAALRSKELGELEANKPLPQQDVQLEEGGDLEPPHQEKISASM